MFNRLHENGDEWKTIDQNIKIKRFIKLNEPIFSEQQLKCPALFIQTF